MTRPGASENERQFTGRVLKEARKRGWLGAHMETMMPVRKPDGRTVAVPNKNADGFPDLVLVHPEHGLVFAELKMPGNRPDEAQIRWLLALRAIGVRVYVWWPRDDVEIIDVLEGRGPAQTSLLPEPALEGAS